MVSLTVAPGAFVVVELEIAVVVVSVTGGREQLATVRAIRAPKIE
ncbi:MAG TPA: hypothetical protein VJQ57_09085 [Acidimicrobiia bacterium]|nr:hypothetical protein [Acidimicrobiia bacterium]